MANRYTPTKNLSSAHSSLFSKKASIQKKDLTDLEGPCLFAPWSFVSNLPLDTLDPRVSENRRVDINSKDMQQEMQALHQTTVDRMACIGVQQMLHKLTNRSQGYRQKFRDAGVH